MDSLAGSQSWSDTPTYASCETPEPVPEAGEPVDVAKPTLATEPKQVASEQSTINDGRVEPAEYTDEDEPSQLDRAPADAAAEEPATDAVPAVEEPSDSPATADGATATTDTPSENPAPPDTLGTDLAPADDPSTDAPPAVTEVVEELRDGLYEIIAGTSEALRMDVTGGSSADGAHVQTWSSNDTIAQRWRLTRNNEGYYTIQNVGSGKYLDVPSAQVAEGAWLWQHVGNGSAAQQWKLVSDPERAGSYVLQSRLDPTYVVDVSNASRAKGARIQLYLANGSAAQSFLFLRIERVIEDGIYTIANAGSGLMLDVSAASLHNGANVQQYTGNRSLAQSFKITYDESNGYYTIISAQSGKALDVKGGRSAKGTNVQQFSHNGSRAQQWAIKRLDGSMGIFSALDGKRST